MTAETFGRAADLRERIDTLSDYAEYLSENFKDLSCYGDYVLRLRTDNPALLRAHALRMAAVLYCIAAETNALWQLQQRKLECEAEFERL